MIEPTLLHYLFAFGFPLVFIWLTDSDNGKIFLGGFLFHAGLTMMLQDFHGKEKYIAMVNEHWVDFHPVIGLYIAGVGAGAFLVSSRRVRVRVAKLLNGGSK